MRLPVLSSSVLALACTLAFTGCQGVALAPPVDALPHAKLASSHVDVDNDRTDIFRVLAIDGHETIDPTDLSPRSVEIDHSALVAAGKPVHLTVDARAFYTNTARRLFWDPMAVKGTIEFVPAADATYVMRGELTPDKSSVWIEDNATHEPVGRKISVPGRAASSAASGVEPTLRSGGA